MFKIACFTILMTVPKICVPEIWSSLFFKVPSIFPIENEMYCLLGSALTYSSNRFQCLNICGSTPNCTMTCFNGTTCILYNTSVSWYWDPNLYRGKVNNFSDLDCYTSYNPPNDITNRIEEKISSSWSPRFWIEHAFDGFSCVGMSDPFGGGTTDSKSFLQVKLDKIYKITKITAQAKLYPKPSYFEEVEVRVGNETGINGNFSAQTLFKYYVGMAASGELVSLFPLAPIYGQYISMSKVNNPTKELAVEEMKIFN